MNADTFKADVTDFIDIFCTEYMNDISVEFDIEMPDDLRATIKMTDSQKMVWIVPISVNPNEDEIAIDIDDAGFLHADSGGLYAYLWHEAKSRISLADLM